MKKCSKCKKEKELNEFSIDKSRYDGFNIQCRTCLAAYYLIVKERNKKINHKKNLVWAAYLKNKKREDNE